MRKFEIGDHIEPQLRVAIYKEMVKRNKIHFEKAENLDIHKNRAVFQQAMKEFRKCEEKLEKQRAALPKGVNPNTIKLLSKEYNKLLFYVNKIEELADQTYFVTLVTLMMNFNDIVKVKKHANDADRGRKIYYEQLNKGGGKHAKNRSKE